MLSSIINFKRNINAYINFDTIFLVTYFFLVCMLDTFFSGFTIYFYIFKFFVLGKKTEIQ